MAIRKLKTKTGEVFQPATTAEAVPSGYEMNIKDLINADRQGVNQIVRFQNHVLGNVHNMANVTIGEDSEPIKIAGTMHRNVYDDVLSIDASTGRIVNRAPGRIIKINYKGTITVPATPLARDYLYLRLCVYTGVDHATVTRQDYELHYGNVAGMSYPFDLQFYRIVNYDANYTTQYMEIGIEHIYGQGLVLKNQQISVEAIQMADQMMLPMII